MELVRRIQAFGRVDGQRGESGGEVTEHSRLDGADEPILNGRPLCDGVV